MANRYWIGGTGNWNDVTHWSDSSGGVGGASVPTSSDNVFFDNNSGTGTITVNAIASMLDFDVTGLAQNITLANAAYTFNVYGNFKLSNYLLTSFTSTGYLYFKATTSVGIYSNSNASSWNRIYFDGVGGTWTNQDNWGTGRIYLTNGIWNTNDRTITITSIGLAAGTKTLNLGNSNVICNSIIDFNGNNANFTLNAGTSTISVFGGGGSGFYTNGKTFYNVITNNISASGNPVFNNLTYPNTSGTKGLFYIGEYEGTLITVNGILNISGSNSSTGRSLIHSNTIGTQRTITAANVIASNVDFRDIKFTNPIDLSDITGGSGDCGGNSGITFTPSQTQYFKHTSGNVNYSDVTKWFSDYARTIQGRVPLPQDDVVFDDLSFVGTSTLSVNVPRIGRSLNMELVNKAVTFSLANDIDCYGDFITFNNITFTTARYVNLFGSNNYLKTYNKIIYGARIYGNYTALSDIYSDAAFDIYKTFNLNNYNLKIALRIATLAGSSFYMGNGIVTLDRNNVSGSLATFASNTVISQGSTIIYSIIGGTVNIGFSGGGNSFNKLQFSGTHTGNFDIIGNNTFNEIIIDAGRKVRVTNGSTQTINRLRVLGKPSNLSTLSSTTAGSRGTITMSSNDYLIDYTNIQDINFTNATTVGQNSVDLGNNVNADFLTTVMRYWVGNGGNWNDTAHWSLQSNGTSGASVPTSTENAMFDLNSFSLAIQTVTVNAAANCLALWFEGISQSFTLANAVYNLSVYGSLSLSSNLNTSFTSTGYLYLKATDSRSIYANGTTKAWNRIYFDGVGGTWTNQDDWNTGIDNTTIYLVNGTWNTNSKTITFNAFNLNSGVKTLVLGNSIINSQAITLFGGGFTFDCGTSTVYFQSSINAYGNTFYDIVFNQRWDTGNISMLEINCRNLTLSNSISSRLQYVINGYLNVTNILSVNGIIDNRLLFTSGTIGTQRTITAANVIASNVDFRDINFTNPIDLSAITGGSGDAGGNTNITFTPAQTQYFKHTSGNVNYSDVTKWFSDYARTIQGRVPLPQDDVVFDDLSFNGTSTLSVNVPRIGRSLNMELVNHAVTIQTTSTNSITCYGNLILGENILTNFPQDDVSRFIYLEGRDGNYILKTYNKSLNSIFVRALNGIYTLNSNLTLANYMQVQLGTFDFNDYDSTLYRFYNSFSYSIAPITYLGNGTMTLTNGNATTGTFHTTGRLYAENSTIKFNPTSGTATPFLEGNGRTFNKVWFSGLHSGFFEIQGNNTFNEIIIDAGRKVRFTGGSTQNVKTFTATGTALNPITITSTITGTTFTLVKTQPLNEKIECDYLNLSYSTVTPTKTWYAGSNSIDGGNNTNWIFGNFTSRDIIVQPNKRILVDNNGRIVW